MVLRTFSRGKTTLHGGYHLSVAAPNPFGVTHCGEQWAPASFQIHPHRHSVWEFYYQLTGTTRWDVNGSPIEVLAGTLLGVAPGIIHALRHSSSSHRFLFLAIDYHPYKAECPPLATHLANKDYILLPESRPAKDPFQQVLHELAGSEAYQEQGIRLECQRFFLALQRLLIGARESRIRPLPSVVVKCQGLIQSDLGASWQLKDLAQACNVSSGHLNHLFKQHLCHTVHDYILEQRMIEGTRLLKETELPIGEIALELGFTSSQHFSTTFKKRSGCPPTTLRKKLAGG